MADAATPDVDALSAWLKQLSAPSASTSPEPQADLPGGGFSQDQASRWLAWRNARIQAQGLPANVSQYMQSHEDYGEQNPPRQINPNAPPNQATPPAVISPPSLDSRTGPNLTPQGPAQPPGYTEDWFHNYETNPSPSYRQAGDIVQQQRTNGDRTAQLLQRIGQPDSTWNPAQTEQQVLSDDLAAHGNLLLGADRTEHTNADADPAMNRLTPQRGVATGDVPLAEPPNTNHPNAVIPIGAYQAAPAIGDQIYRDQGIPSGVRSTDAGGMNRLPQDQRVPPEQWSSDPIMTLLSALRSGQSPLLTKIASQTDRPPSIEDMFTPDQNYERNKAWAKAGPYATALTPEQETQFRSWVTANKVPFNPDEKTPDYDMRGFWMGLQNNDPIAKSAIDPNDSRMHYPDNWKTPYDATFSAQSQWATPAAPNWKGDQLVLPSGAALYDDKSGRWLGPMPQKTGQ